MSLILCMKEAVKKPLYIETLGISIHSSQELCYVIFHNPLLAIDGFVDDQMIRFIREDLDMEFTALKLEKLRRSKEAQEEILFMILQECNYYSAAEINRFRQTIQSIRRMKKTEYLKMKADEFFLHGKYKKAIELYQDIIEHQEEEDKKLLSKIYMNLSSAYAVTSKFSKVIPALQSAYTLSDDENLIKRMYYLSVIDSRYAVPERFENQITDEKRQLWNDEIQNARVHASNAEEVRQIEDMFRGETQKNLEEASALVREWKNEYRSEV